MYKPFRYPKTGLLTWCLDVPRNVATTIWRDETHRLDFNQKHLSLSALKVPADHDRGTDCRYVRILPPLVTNLVQSAPTLFHQKASTKEKK